MGLIRCKTKWVLYRWLRKRGVWKGERWLLPNDQSVIAALKSVDSQFPTDPAALDAVATDLVAQDSSLASGGEKLLGKSAKRDRANALNAQRVLVSIVSPVELPKKDASYSSEAYADFIRSEAWRGIRYLALRLYGNKCRACGRTPANGVQIHVDHIKPCSVDWSRRLDLLNLQVLCEDCNLGKSNLFSDDWR